MTANSKKKPLEQKTASMPSRINESECKLPHEILLEIANGKGVAHIWQIPVKDKDGTIVDFETKEGIIYPDFAERLRAANAAAPFYGPKLSSQSTKELNRESLTDEELDQKIRALLHLSKMEK